MHLNNKRKRPGTLSMQSFMWVGYEEDIVQWILHQNNVNLKDDNLWEDLKKYLETSLNKRLTVKMLKDIWMNNIDPKLERVLRVKLSTRAELGWDDCGELEVLQWTIINERLTCAQNLVRGLGSFLRAPESQQVCAGGTTSNMTDDGNCKRLKDNEVDEVDHLPEQSQPHVKARKKLGISISNYVMQVPLTDNQSLPKQLFSGIEFYVPRNVGNLVDVSDALAKEYFIHIHGGTLISLNQVGSNTICIEGPYLKIDRETLTQRNARVFSCAALDILAESDQRCTFYDFLPYQRKREPTDLKSTSQCITTQPRGQQGGQTRKLAGHKREENAALQQLDGSRTAYTLRIPDVTGPKLPKAVFSLLEFYVIRNENDWREVSTALAIEFFIHIHGGKVVKLKNEIKFETICIASIHQRCNMHTFTLCLGRVFHGRALTELANSDQACGFRDFEGYLVKMEEFERDADALSESHMGNLVDTASKESAGEEQQQQQQQQDLVGIRQPISKKSMKNGRQCPEEVVYTDIIGTPVYKSPAEIDAEEQALIKNHAIRTTQEKEAERERQQEKMNNLLEKMWRRKRTRVSEKDLILSLVFKSTPPDCNISMRSMAEKVLGKFREMSPDAETSKEAVRSMIRCLKPEDVEQFFSDLNLIFEDLTDQMCSNVLQWLQRRSK